VIEKPITCLPPAAAGARAEALYAAYLSDSAINETGTALHHKICHVLGGMYDLPHAQLHAVMLPQTAAFIEAKAYGLLSPAAAILGRGSVAAALFDLRVRLGAPAALSQLGISVEQARACGTAGASRGGR
jgi:maleylacetate reductase